MNSLILDAAITALVAVFFICGFKSGIMKSFLGLAGAIFSAVFSVYLAGICAGFTYNNFIAPQLINNVRSAILQNTPNVSNAFAAFPPLIEATLKSCGITPSLLSHIINNSSADALPEKISALFAPPVIGMLKSIFTILLFIILSLLVRLLSRVLIKVFKASVFKKANSLLGGVFGLLKGYIFICVCMCCLRVIIPLQNPVPEVFSSSSIASTVIFKEMYNNNPLYMIFNKL